MVNEERIKLMTKMAAYEKAEHKKNKNIVAFFKSDYVSLQVLKSVVYTTIAFVIIFAMYILYDFEVFMKEIYRMDLFGFVKNVIISYLIFLGIILLVTHTAALYQYKKAMQSVRGYYAKLKELSRIYGEEE